MTMQNNIKSLLKKWIKRPVRGGDTPPSVGLMAIMKNESLNIREWVDHYKWQGVDKIFLIDNGSTDDILSLIQAEIDSGFIEYFSRLGRHQQAEHYREIYKTAKIGSKVDWLMMADLDEFWFSPLGDIKKALAQIDGEVDLIYANWVVFGSSGWIQHPPSLRAKLIHRHPQLGGHRETKWICRTASIRNPMAIGIHKVRGVDSRRVVSDNERFKLNHYVIQSLHYFQEVKMQRGDVSRQRFESIRTLEYFNSFDQKSTVVDETLASMISQKP